jgi:hypothetical protein
VPPISDLLTAWASESSGFAWVDGRGWVNVQTTAVAYLTDQRRQDDPRAWEASAERFTQAVASSTRWTADPGTDALFDEATPFADFLPLPIAWENKVPPFNVYARRSA